MSRSVFCGNCALTHCESYVVSRLKHQYIMAFLLCGADSQFSFFILPDGLVMHTNLKGKCSIKLNAYTFLRKNKHKSLRFYFKDARRQTAMFVLAAGYLAEMVLCL